MPPKIGNMKAAVLKAAERQSIDLTFKEMVERFCVFEKTDDADLRLRKWIATFGDESAWSIKTEQLQAAAEAMLAGGYKPATANRDISTIGSVYRFAIDRHWHPEGFISPTRGAGGYEEDLRRVEISPKEIQQLLVGAFAFRNQKFGVYVRLLHETGCRKSEILDRTWADVDLDQCTIIAEKTKTGKPRLLHFSPETAALLRKHWPKRNEESLVFEGRIKGSRIDFRTQWEELRAAIGRPDLRQHDLRHHRAAELLRSGISLAVASQVLGHSSLILHRRYGHLENAALRQAVQTSWEARV